MTKHKFIEVVASVTVIAVLSIGCVVYASGEKVQSEPDVKEKEVIEETEKGYVYPITRESEEWKNLTRAERREACLVPEDVLETMSTSQLVMCFLDYPLLFDFYKFSMYENNVYEYFYRYCNVLPVLMEREDCVEELIKVFENMDDETSILQEDALTYLVTCDVVVELMSEEQLAHVKEVIQERVGFPCRMPWEEMEN